MGIAACAGEFDALVERGVCWNAVKMEKLEGSETQCYSDRLRKPLIWALQKLLDTGVERDLPAEGTED